MYQKTITRNGRTITITAGQETIRTILHKITAPEYVTQSTNCGDGSSGMSMMIMFGQAWSWDERPAGMREEYEAALAKYWAAMPDKITGRTNLTTLPRMDYQQYIPTENELEILREARKTPAQRQAEADEQARRREEGVKAAEAREAEKARIAAAQEKLRAEHPELTTGSEKLSGCTLAAENIRRLLSKKWPGQRFSVRTEKYSGGDNITIEWTDGPTETAIKEIGDPFSDTGFDGMTDCSYCKDNEWHIFGSASYMHYRRNIAQATLEPIYAMVQAAAAQIPEGDESSGRDVGDTGFVLFRAPIGGFRLFNDGSLWSNCSTLEGAAIRIAEGRDYYQAPAHGSTVAPDAVSTTGETIVRRNMEHDGIEIKMAERPDEDTIAWLRSRGFRWSFRLKINYRKYDEAIYQECMDRFCAVAA